MARIPQEVIDIAEEIQALGVYLFGSHAAGEASERSDVDVCIVVGPRADLEQADREALRNTTKTIDIKIFETMPLWLKGEVLDHGILVKTTDNAALQEYLWRYRRTWNDERRRAVPSPDDIERIFRARGLA